MLQAYEVKEVIDQGAESMVYRVGSRDGGDFLLTRVALTGEDMSLLGGAGVFEEALADLRAIGHPNLCEVLDGRVDGDGSTCVMSRWVEGKAEVKK